MFDRTTYLKNLGAEVEEEDQVRAAEGLQVVQVLNQGAVEDLGEGQQVLSP